MGGCVSKPETDDLAKGINSVEKGEPISKRPLTKIKPIEEYLLRLMYDDLAKRCKDSIVTQDTFQVFFNNSGLMAELMFSKFDDQKTGAILKEEFMKAFEVNVKGTFEQRANALFEFYSMQKAGGIRYSDLLRILLSYPLQDLNNMLLEDQFLKQLGDLMITYYFGPQNKIQDKTIIEEQSEISAHQLPYKPASFYHPESSDYINMQDNIKKMIEQQKNKKIAKTTHRPSLPPLFEKRQTLQIPEKKMPEAQLRCKKVGSMSLVELKKIRKNYKLKSNITSVVKRFATYLFTSANLDKEKDVFSKHQFCDLLKLHPSIFDVYLQGFHTYIWEVDNLNRPKYTTATCQVSGSCKILANNLTAQVYLKLIRNTLLVFSDKNSEKPCEIINLEGLIVEFDQKETPKKVKLRHRDILYPERILIFQEKESLWLKELNFFKDLCDVSQYVRLERIGKGNFSTVYKCKSKIKGQLAALKVIDPAKLTPNQIAVLKRQIGILKQCHHPHIIKFIQEYKTHARIYIITELCSEGDLFDYVKKKTFLEEYEAAVIFRQLTEAIVYLNNELGIIHRDLKPQNIMMSLTEDKKMVKRVKIIDFGFGVYKDKLKDLTEDEKYAGTPGFMAPEMLQMKQYDEKIDAFSLGIILYFMLYGYLPFQSNYFEQIRDMTLNCNIQLTNSHWSNVSSEAKDLIGKILTSADKRISSKKILDHPWLKNIEQLKEWEGKNKKRVRILD